MHIVRCDGLTRNLQLAAYPVLFPIYLMRYDLQIPEVPETKSLTCVVRAHSKDVRKVLCLTYIHSQQLYAQALTNVVHGAMEIGSLLQEASSAAPCSPARKLPHAMDDTPAWETQGIWCGFSTITTPALASSLDWFYEAVTDWIEEKVQSKSNIDALARYGVDMDHPYVRVFTKEEVDANRRFLGMSAKIWVELERLKVYFYPIFIILRLTFCVERVTGGFTERRGKSPNARRGR